MITGMLPMNTGKMGGSMNESTYIRLNILILEVERVLPDVDADDRVMGCAKQR
jgi:hypothetical protein